MQLSNRIRPNFCHVFFPQLFSQQQDLEHKSQENLNENDKCTLLNQQRPRTTYNKHYTRASRFNKFFFIVLTNKTSPTYSISIYMHRPVPMNVVIFQIPGHVNIFKPLWALLLLHQLCFIQFRELIQNRPCLLLRNWTVEWFEYGGHRDAHFGFFTMIKYHHLLIVGLAWIHLIWVTFWAAQVLIVFDCIRYGQLTCSRPLVRIFRMHVVTFRHFSLEYWCFFALVTAFDQFFSFIIFFFKFYSP